MNVNFDNQSSGPPMAGRFGSNETKKKFFQNNPMMSTKDLASQATAPNFG